MRFIVDSHKRMKFYTCTISSLCETRTATYTTLLATHLHLIPYGYVYYLQKVLIQRHDEPCTLLLDTAHQTREMFIRFFSLLLPVISRKSQNPWGCPGVVLLPCDVPEIGKSPVLRFQAQLLIKKYFNRKSTSFFFNKAVDT